MPSTRIIHAQYANEIAQELRSLRRQSGVRQIDVAEHIRVSTPTITHWERAREVPCLTRIVQLASFYEIDAEALLVRIARSAPCPNMNDLRIPAGQTVMRAILTHYLATHERSPRLLGSNNGVLGSSPSPPQEAIPRAQYARRPYRAVLSRALSDIRTLTTHYDQNDVARRLGIEQSNLSAWETGAVSPELPPLVQLVNEVYGACVQQFLIDVAAQAEWDPRVPLINMREGSQVLKEIPKTQPVLFALVSYELGSRVPATWLSSPRSATRRSARARRRDRA
ncbi:helix-turn-helix transcriptional regulator [Nocardia sp. NRRL S-836]|uniref:helix-turn-helix domain-containing protein n=1 Tax=Nocardia sp. NRRL S-836 TaxID=1519492 RepID=UPI0009E8747F|nr:helix-turn-helix transcriptional regulator [Nocardia sp. NRRL S-836]